MANLLDFTGWVIHSITFQVKEWNQVSLNSARFYRIEFSVASFNELLFSVLQFSHLSIWGSVGLWFLFLAVYPHMWPSINIGAEMVGMVRESFFYTYVLP